MKIERHRTEGLDGLYVQFACEYRKPYREEKIAPGVTGGYDRHGELAFIEIVGRTGELVHDPDRLEAIGFAAVEVEQGP